MRRRPGTPWAALVALVLGALASGCAVAPPPAEPSSPPPAPPPPPVMEQHQPLSDLDAFEHDLDVSERLVLAQIDRKSRERFAEPPGQAEGAGASRAEPDASAAHDKRKPESSKPARATSAPAPTPAEPTKDFESNDDRSERASVGSSCDLCCRALASMKSAAEGICRITGPDDARCTGANARVAQRADDVARAGCECREPR